MYGLNIQYIMIVVVGDRNEYMIEKEEIKTHHESGSDDDNL